MNNIYTKFNDEKKIIKNTTLRIIYNYLSILYVKFFRLSFILDVLSWHRAQSRMVIIYYDIQYNIEKI